ncbi:MAG: hypothetical protein DRG11_00515 [Epsilonproteobacteria bacterium]|nr:MAG: hypothetical protein DRG11_00515 [Campylobacterota bacterium]
MKNSIALIELIVSIVLLSVLFAGSSNFALKIYQLNEKNYHQALNKIDLESTKLFLQKQVQSGVDISTKLNNITSSKTKSTLTYSGKSLLYNITEFKLKKVSKKYFINICINTKTNICKSWVF